VQRGAAGEVGGGVPVKMVKGWAVPDFDDQWEGLIAEDGTYQYPNLIAAVSRCKRLRTVIDGGAHIGTWSRVFASFFDRVIAFEPSPDTFECLLENVKLGNVEILNQALGQKRGKVRMTLDGFEGTKREHNAGSRYCAKGGDIARVTVDSLELKDLDLLKLDIEGSEVHALKGAKHTLIRCRPVVLFENKFEWKRHGFKENAPHRFLRSLGAKKLDHVGVDEVWGWK
jgi:FkbM family methyltransferase